MIIFTSISSLVRCLLRSLAHFLIRLFDFFVVESSVGFSHSVMSDSLWPHGLQHAFCLFFFFLAMLHSKQDLSSLTRDWTWVLCSGGKEPYPLDCQLVLFSSVTLSCVWFCDPMECQVVLRVLFKFWITIHYQICLLYIFYPCLWFVFSFLILSFAEQKFLILVKSSLSIISFMNCVFGKQITTPKVI